MEKDNKRNIIINAEVKRVLGEFQRHKGESYSRLINGITSMLLQNCDDLDIDTPELLHMLIDLSVLKDDVQILSRIPMDYYGSYIMNCINKAEEAEIDAESGDDPQL